MLNIFSPIPCLSQGWEWQNPLPTGNPILCSDFVDSLNGWFGSSVGTILHTTDGGNSWEILRTDTMELHSQSIDFIDRQEGWAVGNLSGGPSYIIHTTDGGKEWIVQFVKSLPSFTTIEFRDQKHGWAGTYLGDIYYTIDGGETWELGRTGGGNVTSIVFLDTLRGWAEGIQMPLLYSEDGGKSWSADTTGIIGTNVFFSDSLHGWITSWDRLLRTVDGGKTWLDDLSTVTGDPHALVTDLFFVDTLSGWATVWEEGVFRTTDGGWTWEQITTKMPEIEHGAYFFFTPQSGWIGFSRTWDGGKTLTYQKKSFTPRYGPSDMWVLYMGISDVDFVNEQIGWIVGDKGLIGKTVDRGKSWHLQESGIESGLYSVFSLDESRVWAVGWGGVILNTIDGGETWKLRHRQIGSRTVHRAVTFIDSLKGWIVGGYSTGWILHTEDGGDTWKDQTPGVIPDVYDVTFVNENAGWVAASGYGGAIYHTTDGGETWIPQLENQPHHLKTVFFVNEYVGWAAGDNWIVHTADGGENWIVQSSDEGIYPADLFFIDENIGWTCGIIGEVFSTVDGGSTWQKQYTGTTRTLQAVEFIDANTGWSVGSNSTIIHTTTGGLTNVKEDFSSEYIAEGFHLYPNYPNPFNQQTVISYKLMERGIVRLAIYDIQGRQVITLVDGIQSPGLHRITWNGKNKKGRDVPSGIYLYHIQFLGVFQKTGKMILIR